MERNEKKASRPQILKLAKTLEIDEDELMTLWLSDRLLDMLKEEKVAYDVLKLTEKRIKQR